MEEHDPASLDALLSMIGQAPTQPQQWESSVKAMQHAFRARSAVLFTPQPQPDAPPFAVVHGELAAGVDDYFAHWATRDAWNLAGDRKGVFKTAGEVRCGQEFIDDHDLMKTDFFHEWARPHGAEQLLSVKITDERDTRAPVLHFTLFRAWEDGPFKLQDKQRLQVLAPHLRAAAQVSTGLWPVTGQRALAAQSLNAFGQACWVLRQDGRIEFASAEAERLAHEQAWAGVQWGRLARLGHLDQLDLQRRLRTLSTLQARPHEVVVSAMIDGRLQGAVLRLLPIRQAPLFEPAWPHACALVWLELAASTRFNDRRAHWLAHLQQERGLSPALCEVLKMTGDGLTAAQIAEQRQVQVCTVKTQLNELRTRLGVRRLSDLVQLSRGK
jgi:DNA-binding CsgD family transcriptional regulator